MLCRFTSNPGKKPYWLFFLIVFLNLASSIPAVSQDPGNGFFDHEVAWSQSTSRGSHFRGYQPDPPSDTAKPHQDYYFKPGPPIDLKLDYGPVSLGMAMDIALAPVSASNSQDLLISRIWQGM